VRLTPPMDWGWVGLAENRQQSNSQE